MLIAIFGPTASGKTAVAEALATRLGSEVVSCDAMQAYRGLPILTNQPESPTRLAAIWELSHEGSVGEYQPLAHAAIDELLAGAGGAVLAGGTGLYLRAAIADLHLPPPPEVSLRRRTEVLYDRLGPNGAHGLLGERDPEAALGVHPNDRRRVVRALELHELGSSLVPEQDRLWAGEVRHHTLVVGLEVTKEELTRRIRARTRAMFEAGVQEEARAALRTRVSPSAGKALGLVEAATLATAEAMERIEVRTRRYAAYQRKWMRRIPGLASVEAERPPEEVADEILALARTRQHLSAHG